MKSVLAGGERIENMLGGFEREAGGMCAQLAGVFV